MLPRLPSTLPRLCLLLSPTRENLANLYALVIYQFVQSVQPITNRGSRGVCCRCREIGRTVEARAASRIDARAGVARTVLS